MQSGLSGISLRLIGVLLLFVPGILGLDCFFRAAKKKVPLSQLQRYVYSAFISMSSLIVLYVLSPIYFSPTTAWTSMTVENFNIVTETDFISLPFSNLFALYLVHIFVTVVLAGGFGLLVNYRTDGDRDLRDPWHYAFAVVPSDGEDIEVVMSDGSIIQGEYNKQAWDETKRELYLDSPKEVEYDSKTEELLRDISLGRSILLQEGEISRIIFSESDPQGTQEYKVEEDPSLATASIFNDFDQTNLKEFEGESQESGSGQELNLPEEEENSSEI